MCGNNYRLKVYEIVPPVGSIEMLANDYALAEPVGKDNLIAAGRDFTCVIADLEENDAGDKHELRCFGEAFRFGDTRVGIEGFPHLTFSGTRFKGRVTALGAHACKICLAEKSEASSTLHCWEWGIPSKCRTAYAKHGVWAQVGWSQELDPSYDITALAVGGTHICTRVGSENVMCYGWNDHGQLGRGNTEPIDAARNDLDGKRIFEDESHVFVELGAEVNTGTLVSGWAAMLLGGAVFVAFCYWFFLACMCNAVISVSNACLKVPQKRMKRAAARAEGGETKVGGTQDKAV
ncbi:unnamed protein product [Chrysoparadoxa australica]